MKPLHTVTPLWESQTLSEAAGRRVLLKMEALQPTGSFKIRGVGHLCCKSCEAGAAKLVGSSGGNAGCALAYAARKLNMKATVFVPRSTSRWMRDIIAREGAEVIEHGASWDDAHARALETAGRENAAYIPPFDHPEIWNGHASMIREIDDEGIKPGIVVLSVGGGGLLCGVLQGLHAAGWNDVPVTAVETVGAASFAASVEAGRLVTLPEITSVATTLGARTVTAEALEWTRRHAITNQTVTDRAAIDACKRFAGEHRLLVEPACGAALAAVYDGTGIPAARDPVVVIVCGGAGVNLELLQEWDSREYES